MRLKLQRPVASSSGSPEAAPCAPEHAGGLHAGAAWASVATGADELAMIAAAWQAEPDPAARLALAPALAAALADAPEQAQALGVLRHAECTDAIRAEVARRSADEVRRQAAVMAIRDEKILLQLAIAAELADVRAVAAERIRSPAALRALADGGAGRELSLTGLDAAAERASQFVPRILQQHLVDDPAGRAWVATGTAAFVDISGFTRLSERLARRGREGAEQITEAIGASFDRILYLARENGGSLLKFGGDALLLWFDGEHHAPRACRAAVLMRRVLRDVGRIAVPGATVTLRMAQGVHSGAFHFFAVGSSQVEFLTVGPAWSRLVAMEHAACAGQILVSPETAALLPARCQGAACGPGVLLQREPVKTWGRISWPVRPTMRAETLARCLSPAVRQHVLGGSSTSEHRAVTVAFVRFEGVDRLVSERGTVTAAKALHRLVTTVEDAAREQDICFLGSDVDHDGGKLILTAGAPKVTGDDEERMLLALRTIVATDLPLEVRIGVHRGPVFAGEIGPQYRRTYTVMGDVVNLAARLMAKAAPGHIYATAEVLDHSDTVFDTTELEPFAVKGKTHRIKAWSVGRAAGSRTRQQALQTLPLIGRDAERLLLRQAVADVRGDGGCLVLMTGEAGLGKTRLLDALREDARDFRILHTSCEAYTASVPYVVWRELLRELMGIARADPDQVVMDRLGKLIATHAPELAPWLPLLAGTLGIELPATSEVEMLAEANRRAKLHEIVVCFLDVTMTGPTLLVIDDAQHMDRASAELLAFLADRLAERPWLVAVAGRSAPNGVATADPSRTRTVALTPLSPEDALRYALLATEQQALQRHVLDVVTRRSGGNPQFLRDLICSALESGGVAALPDSAEAATMARIDALAPEDRAVVRHAAVLGLTFHPRMLGWFAEALDAPEPGPATWTRLQDLFEDDGEGYVRFRRTLVREAAYEGLPYKLRRRLHGIVAERLTEELEYPEEAAAILSLHYGHAGEHAPAFQFAVIAAKRAEAMYAYVEAAELYARALEAARHVAEAHGEGAAIQEAQADCWHRAAEFDKALHAYARAHELVREPVVQARLRLKRARLEERLGRYRQALAWASRARSLLAAVDTPEARRQMAQAGAWYATMLRAQGRTREALHWARRTLEEAERADDPEALGTSYFVMSASHAMLGRSDCETLMKQALDAYQRSGNRARQASLLANLGVMCQWQGRWDEAMAYYERGRAESLKVGDTVNAALAHINVAEILIDRGQLERANDLLRETLPLWKASRYRLFLGACLSLIGRVALRQGRYEEALERLQDARTNFAAVGAEQELPAIDARIAECRVYMRETEAALAATEAVRNGAATGAGVSDVTPIVERVRGFALLQRGDIRAAGEAFEAALAAARAKNDLGEVSLGLRSLIELAHRQAHEPPPALVTENAALLEQLRIEQMPAMPPA